MKLTWLKRPTIAVGLSSCLVLSLVLLLQTTPAQAGGSGGCGYGCNTTTTKMKYPTTTKATYPSTTKVTYPSTTKPTYPTSTTKPHHPTTTYPTTPPTSKPPHQTTTTRPPHMTTTTFPFPTSTSRPPHQTTTTRPPHQTTTTRPPHMTTTTSPNETTTTAPEETTTTLPGEFNFLTLVARVIGGPATPADFDLFANGPISFNGTTDNANVTLVPVPPGRYLLSFVADALANDPYTNMGWDCAGSESSTSESVTMGIDEDALCVITFTEAAVVTTTTAPGVTTTAPRAVTTVPSTPSTPTTAPAGHTTPGCPTCVVTPTHYRDHHPGHADSDHHQPSWSQRAAGHDRLQRATGLRQRSAADRGGWPGGSAGPEAQEVASRLISGSGVLGEVPPDPEIPSGRLRLRLRCTRALPGSHHRCCRAAGGAGAQGRSGAAGRRAW